MGSYLNPGCGNFEMALRSQIYIDKSRLIEQTNQCLGTLQRFMCVSRPRRFGKSMAMDMLAAYYCRSLDTAQYFEQMQISEVESYRQHLNQYNVLKINMQDFLSTTNSVEEMLRMLQKYIIFDLLVELKWNQTVEGAIAQIKEKQYVDALKDYHGNLLLVGINYDKKSKEHSCKIEKIKKF